MLIGLLSAGGSPGVTTTLLAMGSMWPASVVVVDADPCGGDVAAASGGMVDASVGNVLELVRRGRGGRVPAVLDSQVQVSGVGVAVVAGLGDPAQAVALPWPELADGLVSVTDRDVLVDLGRWSSPFHAAPVLRVCDLVVLVVRTRTRALRRAERMLPLIRADLDRSSPGHAGVDLLVVDDGGSFATEDIARRLRVPMLGEISFDARAAAVFSDSATPPRHLERSALLRSLGPVVRTVGQLAEQRRAVTSHTGLTLGRAPTTPTPSAPTPSAYTTVVGDVPAAAVGLEVMPRTTRRLSAVPPRGTPT